MGVLTSKNTRDIMRSVIRTGRESTRWPLAYLIVTAISVGLFAGVWYGLQDPARIAELLTVGFIAALYTITSAVHYYHVAKTQRKQTTPVVNKW